MLFPSFPFAYFQLWDTFREGKVIPPINLRTKSDEKPSQNSKDVAVLAESLGLDSETAVYDTARSLARGRFLRSRVRSSGRLIIYNYASKKRFVLETKQEDSELLLIDQNYIYYRVNDELFKATIGGDLGQGVMIAQGEMVSDVHWAFSSAP